MISSVRAGAESSPAVQTPPPYKASAENTLPGEREIDSADHHRRLDGGVLRTAGPSYQFWYF